MKMFSFLSFELWALYFVMLSLKYQVQSTKSVLNILVKELDFVALLTHFDAEQVAH